MAKPRKPPPEVTLDYLTQQTDYDPAAVKAVGEYMAIIKAGGSPTIQYSKFTGWIVRDTGIKPAPYGDQPV